MLSYHIVWDEGRESLVNSYSQLSETISMKPNASTHLVGIYITGTPTGSMNSDPSSKIRKLYQKLEKVLVKLH